MSSKDVLLRLYDIKQHWSDEDLRAHQMWPKVINGIKKFYFNRMTCINHQTWQWVLYRFAEQNIKGRSKYAQMVRDGKYKFSDICWLYCRPKGYESQITWLGVIGPDFIDITSDFSVDEKHRWFINIK